MSRICKAFGKKKAFISFLTAGDPSLEATEEFILALAEAGSDLIEIGIPFSDPVAEGEVIQRANIRALAAGVRTDKIFGMVKKVRLKSQVPLVLLTYMNPVFVYGIDNFLKKCEECGIDGLIIPDLPFEERSEVLDISEKYGVDLITLIAPTSQDRIQTLAKNATGFIYIVSSMGVTGVRSEIKTNINSIVADIRQVSDAPVAVGFGIATAEQAVEIAQMTDGVIVGSAIVKIIEQYGEFAGTHLFEYVKGIKNSLVNAY